MINSGQLIFTGISGTTISEEEQVFIEDNNIGGVILFSNNYESPAQLAELVNSIQILRREYPLFIAVDHEGGRVIRFKKHFTSFPPMMDIAKTNSPKTCFEIHKIMAQELSSCGINVNFSPCCDVLSNDNNKVIGNRSFGSDPDIVSKFVSSAIRGLQTHEVMGCAKHFPGHGSTSKDTHNQAVIVKTPMADIKNKEFPPFIKAVKSRVDFVMMSHLVVDAIDESNPCTFSQNAYKILRDDMRYKKIIVTDDMQMKAITENYSVEDATILALNAGADMLIYRDMEFAKKAVAAINSALKTKTLKNCLFNEKYKRILETKENKLKEYRPIYIPEIESKINAKTSQLFLEELMSRISPEN